MQEITQAQPRLCLDNSIQEKAARVVAKHPKATANSASALIFGVGLIAIGIGLTIASKKFSIPRGVAGGVIAGWTVIGGAGLLTARHICKKHANEFFSEETMKDWAKVAGDHLSTKDYKFFNSFDDAAEAYIQANFGTLTNELTEKFKEEMQGAVNVNRDNYLSPAIYPLSGACKIWGDGTEGSPANDLAPIYGDEDTFTRACQTKGVEAKYADYQKPKSDIALGETTSAIGQVNGITHVLEDGFYKTTVSEVGQALAVIDGHSDEGVVTNLVNDHLGELLKTAHQNHPDNPSLALQKVIDGLEALYLEKYRKGEVSGGACLTLTFIPENSNELYVATLGDTEAALLRNGKLIPLSLPSDWEVEEESQRAEMYLKAAGTPETDIMRPNSRGMRQFPAAQTHGCSEVSRSIGDFRFKHVPPPDQYQQFAPLAVANQGLPINFEKLPKGSQKMISTKAHITKVVLKPGDEIVMGSDGFFDNYTWPNLEADLNQGYSTQTLFDKASTGERAPNAKLKADDIVVVIQKVAARQ